MVGDIQDAGDVLEIFFAYAAIQPTGIFKVEAQTSCGSDHKEPVTLYRFKKYSRKDG